MKKLLVISYLALCFFAGIGIAAAGSAINDNNYDG